jgi:hypothetical protein
LNSNALLKMDGFGRGLASQHSMFDKGNFSHILKKS